MKKDEIIENLKEIRMIARFTPSEWTAYINKQMEGYGFKESKPEDSYPERLGYIRATLDRILN